MSAKLLTKDYKNILDFYNIPIPNSSKKIKEKAETIMADKLCKCIKSVKKGNPNLEKKGIAICTKSIFNNKGYTRGKFRCLTKQNSNKKKFVRLTKKRSALKIK